MRKHSSATRYFQFLMNSPTRCPEDQFRPALAFYAKNITLHSQSRFMNMMQRAECNDQVLKYSTTLDTLQYIQYNTYNTVQYNTHRWLDRRPVLCRFQQHFNLPPFGILQSTETMFFNSENLFTLMFNRFRKHVKPILSQRLHKFELLPCIQPDSFFVNPGTAGFVPPLNHKEFAEKHGIG